MFNLPKEVAALVDSFRRDESAVWLFGSRANGTDTALSDWDLLVFGSKDMLERLSSQSPVVGVDLLVVYDGDRFESPWSKTAEGIVKSGSLSSWGWRALSDQESTYLGTKWPDDWGTPKKALRL